MTCESGGHPDAYNAGSMGLMQINYSAHVNLVGPDASVLYDPATNVQIAFEIWSDSRWIPWSCKP